MKYFTSNGLWFFPGGFEKAIGGTLKFDKDGIKLSLIGSFGEAWSPVSERYAVVQGIVAESPYGKFVTLLDGRRQRLSFSFRGVASDVISFPKAIVGGSHFDDDPTLFDSSYFKFTYLLDWIGMTGMDYQFTSAQSKRSTIAYEDQDAIQFTMGSETVSTHVSAVINRRHHFASIEESALIEVEPVGRKTVSQLFEDESRRLQNLLTFCTDTPNGINEIVYTSKDNEHEVPQLYSVIYDAIFPAPERKDYLYPHDMIATLSDFREHGINVFDEWKRFSEENSGFVSVYFASQYAPPRFLEEKFSGVLVSFGLLCSRANNVSDKAKSVLADFRSSLDANFSAGEAELLRHAIPVESEIDMPFRMIELLRENRTVMDKMIPDFDDFTRSVFGTLDFVRRRPHNVHGLQGKDMLFAMEKIKVLIKLVVLQKIGFDNATAAKLINRNHRINYLRISG